MGKWSWLRGKFPKFQAEDADHALRIQKAQEAIKLELQEAGLPVDLGQLGERYNKERNLKDKKEDELSDINLKIEALTQMVTTEFDQQHITQFRLDNGASISLKDDAYTQVVDKDEWLGWVKETGREHLLSVHYQTMNSLVKEMLEQGVEPPPGLKVFLKTGLILRR